MKYRKLHQIGADVSAIGLGCMGMSEFYGESDDAQSLETLEHALDIGINFFDSADTYGSGHNEELLGKFARKNRDKMVLASKCGIKRKPGEYARTIDSSPDYIRTACEASLKRMGLETIDLYYLHRYTGKEPIEDVAETFKQLIAEGKIRGYGICEVSEDTLRRAHAIHPVTALQTEYSLWTRDVEARILPACEELDIAFVAYSPLGRGFLTGKLSDTDKLADNDFRKSNPRFQQETLLRNKVLLNSVEAVADKYGCTTGQVALAWLLARSGNVIPIPGTRRVTYLDENAGATDIHLQKSDVEMLNSVFAPEAIAGERYTVEGMKGLNR